MLGPIGALAGLIGGGLKSVHVVSARSEANEALLEVSFAEYKKLLKQVSDSESRRLAEEDESSRANVRLSRATSAYRAKLDRLEEDSAAKLITSTEYEQRLAQARSALLEERL